MDSERATKLHNILSTGTAEIHKGMDVCKELDEKINSDMYADKLKRDKLIPQKIAAKNAYELRYKTMLSDAYSLIDEYESWLRDADTLHPEDMTEDVKLLQSGIKLKQRDITSMLERNKGNRTMEQIILRYAEDNKIDAGMVYREALGEGMEDLNNAKMLVDAYKKYVFDDDAQQVLDRFFVMEE